MSSLFTHHLLIRNDFGVNFVRPLHSVLNCSFNQICHFAFIEEHAPQQSKVEQPVTVTLSGPSDRQEEEVDQEVSLTTSEETAV